MIYACEDCGFLFCDGTGVTQLGSNTEFNCTAGVGRDSSGNLYVADYYNNMLKKVSPDGSTITTTDTDIKVNYAKTGTDNLVNADNSAELGNFTNLAVVNKITATYTIAAISDQSMPDLTAGYTPGSQETKNITITRTGTGNLDNLSVALGGANAFSFVATQPAVTTLNAATPSTAFTLKANDGLAAGTYLVFNSRAF